MFDLGALRVVETWGDNVPKGKWTDFFRAVKAKKSEHVVFSWIEWPSKKKRDAGMKRMMTDPKIAAQFKDMPFDGKRMIFGGFWKPEGGAGGPQFGCGVPAAI